MPNFASQEELKALNDWANLGIQNKWLDIGVGAQGVTDKRLTSRMYGHRYKYPQIVKDLSDRVRKFVGIDEYPLIVAHGRDGVVVSCTFPGGDVYKHKDPKSLTGEATLRCNILSQKADEGGTLFVDGQQVGFEVGDLHCYLVSEHEHWTDEVKGNTPRIMWMFGAHVPAEDWNSGKIKINYGLS